jgi:tetratricopeptide (TPR) repeat protein
MRFHNDNIDRTEYLEDLLMTSFGLLNNIIYYRDAEREILFSMHTVFRVGEIEKVGDNSRFWQVKLQLTSDNDQLLIGLTKRIREETFQNTNGWYRLSILLLKLGEFDRAIQIYQTLFDLAYDKTDKASCYGQLGKIKLGQGDYMGAILSYEKALDIYEGPYFPDQFAIVKCFCNFGTVYQGMGEFSKTNYIS